MAEAVVEERQLLKAMRWYDGFVVALANPGFLIGSLGFSIGVLGGWGAMFLWGVSMFIGTLSNWIYSESAAMFPDKPGGISLYANEGWRKYFTFIGPVATFGYWFAWSSVLALFGIIIGNLIQAEWATGQDWTFSTGGADVGFPHMIAIAVIVVVWAINIFGVRPSVWMAYITGGLLMIPLLVFILITYLTGDWSSSNMVWSVGDWKTAVVWLYIMGWSAYGVETCAAFAPEYKDTVHDTALALRSAAVFSLGVYILLPLGVAGTVPLDTISSDATGVAYLVDGFNAVLGGGGDVMVVLLIASLFISMNTATADGSRALYGIARDGVTIKQLYHLNRFHVPARAMTLDMVINILLVLFVGNILAILVAGNLGYMSAHFFALTGFLLLRKDRPNWPRPIRLARPWVGIAALLAAINAFFIIIGASNPSLTGYGGRKETWIGIGVLLFSIVLYIFRRAVQDKAPVHLREETPETPAAAPTTPAGMPAA
ncbi:MAG TPA: APC family permease [Gaiellaceae bacterium]|nr:APC family permease [Gaiellaceae bacterium]